MTRPGIEPQSPGPLTNTLLIIPMVQYSSTYLNFIHIDVNMVIDDHKLFHVKIFNMFMSNIHTTFKI